MAELVSDALFGDLDELGQATAKDAPCRFCFAWFHGALQPRNGLQTR